jgi:hypothetical protein
VTVRTPLRGDLDDGHAVDGATRHRQRLSRGECDERATLYTVQMYDDGVRAGT